jgi:hypothetical protein
MLFVLRTCKELWAREEWKRELVVRSSFLNCGRVVKKPDQYLPCFWAYGKESSLLIEKPLLENIFLSLSDW